MELVNLTRNGVLERLTNTLKMKKTLIIISYIVLISFIIGEAAEYLPLVYNPFPIPGHLDYVASGNFSDVNLTVNLICMDGGSCHNLTNMNDSIIWENSTGEAKLRSPQNVNIQEENITNVTIIVGRNSTYSYFDITTGNAGVVLI